MTAKELDAFKCVDVSKVKREELVDIRDVGIARDLPVEERIREFVKQVKNPYCFKVGDVVVKTVFSSNGGSFEKRFQRVLSGLE